MGYGGETDFHKLRGGEGPHVWVEAAVGGGGGEK